MITGQHGPADKRDKMNQTRRDALRETKRERMNRRATELFALGVITGIIPMALMVMWDLFITAVI